MIARPHALARTTICETEKADLPTSGAIPLCSHTAKPRRWRATWTADSDGDTRLSTTLDTRDKTIKETRAT